MPGCQQHAWETALSIEPGFLVLHRKILQQLRHMGSCGVFGSAETNDALVTRTRRLPLHILIQVQNPAGITGENFPGRRQLHGARCAQQQRLADFPLQLAEMPAYRQLAHIRTVGCPLEQPSSVTKR